MSKGHVFLAQNSKVDYVTQAFCLAATIKNNNKINSTCIITNDFVPDDYMWAFDHVIQIPWEDQANGSDWKIENRWKIIHATPFKESLVYDTDMLVLTTNDHWWKYFKSDVSLTSKVLDYRGNVISSDFYRKAFTMNNLPSVYMGVHYIRKTKRAYEFYKWLEIITKNFEKFYEEFTPNQPQKFCSMDLNAALAVKFMSAEYEFTNSIMSFTHMKPALQSWNKVPGSWLDVVDRNFIDRKSLKVGNHHQTGIFHYCDDRFLNQQILENLWRPL